MAIEIREAAAQDGDALVELSLTVHALHVGWRPDIFRTPSVTDMKTHCTECLGQEGLRVYVAAQEGRILGFIIVRCVERPGHILMHPRRFMDIESICVASQERRKGTGRALLEKAKEFAREQGLRRIELNVWAENAEAQRAFAAWGFQLQSERLALEV